MNKLDSLDRLGPITDEMLAGLHADQQMKARIRAAAKGQGRAKKRSVQRALVPALCCAALAFVCVGAVNLRGVAPAPQAAQIETIAAGDGAAVMMMRSNQVADLGDHARFLQAGDVVKGVFVLEGFRGWGARRGGGSGACGGARRTARSGRLRRRRCTRHGASGCTRHGASELQWARVFSPCRLLRGMKHIEE